MAVQLFCKGGSQVFDEYIYYEMLKTGLWFLSPEEVDKAAAAKEINKDVEQEKGSTTEAAQTNKEIRAAAKLAGIDKYKTARIETLKMELMTDDSQH